MIEQAIGKVVSVEDQTLSLEVGSIALRLCIPDERNYRVNEQARVYVHMHWNQENGPQLYGFSSESERAVFCMVITCTGVGPRMGLAMLFQLGFQGVLVALRDGDKKALSQVSGIGTKRAEQMIVHLKEKAAKLADKYTIEQGDSEWKSLQEALGALNYSRLEITRVVGYLRKQEELSRACTFDLLMRNALAYLSRQTG